MLDDEVTSPEGMAKAYREPPKEPEPEPEPPDTLG